MTEPYRRRVGSARPSQLMFTGGIGGLIELPNFTVLVQGLDEWNYSRMGDASVVIDEPRVLAAVRSRLQAPALKELRSAPWLEGDPADRSGVAQQVGVPVTPFPAWLRCSSCNLLGSLEGGAFGFVNQIASRPHDAQFVHRNCRQKDRFAVPARFLLGCLNAHLDEFPYVWFVHRGSGCPQQRYPVLKMYDRGSDAAANVTIKCESCSQTRNMMDAQGEQKMENLPSCRGRHPHLGTFGPCDEPSRLLVLGASNQWFGSSVNALAVPPTAANELQAEVDKLWETLNKITSYEVMQYAYSVQFQHSLGRWPIEQVWEVMEARRDGSGPATVLDSDLLTPEWQLLTQTPAPPVSADFALRPVGVPTQARSRLAEVRQVERLRLVRAMIGFTRFDAPDPEEPDLVAVAPLSRAAKPEWVPATEVRGEGLFVRLADEALADWESRMGAQVDLQRRHRDAYARFRQNRYSGRYAEPPGGWAAGWPGMRYYLVHSLSHILLRAISLECGYAAASLAERIYARPEQGMAGLLIYTAVPDAEGTLGGLVSLGEPDKFARVLDRALRDARSCSSDPLCSEQEPAAGSDLCHAASCHVCMFLSETSCERGNRFLDRRLLVDLGRPDVAYWSET